MERKKGSKKAPPPADASGFDWSPSPRNLGEVEALRIRPAKNRLTQVARTGGRKLFDQAAKALFLEWFAATCNVRFSAAKAGVHEKTVYKHRMTDAAFAQGWDAALQQGYARLEARLLQEVHSPPHPAHPRDADESPSPSRGEGLEVRGDLDDPEVEERFDPQLALLLLREHARRLSTGSRQGWGSADRRKAGAMPRVASNQEVAEALAKRLKGFALRVQGEKPPLPNPSPAEGRGAKE